MIICNTRNLQSSTTGVQRYTSEILRSFSTHGAEVVNISPRYRLAGISGHLWEQLVLPSELKGRLLWSPSNTGPIMVENQVVSVMDCSPLDHPEWSSKKFSSWYQFLLPRLMQRVRKIITISEFSKSRILNFCPAIESKVEVTPLGVDNRFTPSDKHSINDVLASLQIPSKQYILALGSLEPRKNLKTLLLAWEILAPKLPNEVWLILAGAKGKEIVFGDHPIENLPPRVFLTGHVPDELLPSLYSGAIASVYLSLYEGFGLPPLESMACGTPVVASNAGAIPEVVGDASLLIDPLDVEGVCHQISSLVLDQELRRRLSIKGILQAQSFTWARTAQLTYDILQKAGGL